MLYAAPFKEVRAGDENPWLATAGMFADDPTLEPMLVEIYAARDAESKEANGIYMMDASNLEQFIIQNNIEAQLVLLEVETPTVEAAAEVVGARPEQIGKSILFLADGRPVLVVANGLTRVDYKRLADYLGISRRRIKLANGEQVLAITGYPVGTVPPFGHRERLETVVEAGVMRQDELYAGGGGINALVKLRTAELLRVLAAEVVELADVG